MKNQSGHQDVQKEYLESMREVARLVDKIFNPDGKKKIGFVLLAFPFGEKPDARMNYMSNGNRADVLLSMKEFIGRAEGNLKVKEEMQ